MASIFTPTNFGTALGPYSIDLTDCMGDSVSVINANTNYLASYTAAVSSTASSQITTLSTYATGTALLSSNGYQRLPGGLIIQWGESGTYTTQATFSAVFPIPFTAQCFNVQATWKLNKAGSAGADDTWAQTVNYDKNRAQFQVQNATNPIPSIGRVAWFAVGY